jgi:hypothetical protein
VYLTISSYTNKAPIPPNIIFCLFKIMIFDEKIRKIKRGVLPPLK